MAGLLVMAVSLPAFGRPNRLGAIDDYCLAVRSEFVESAPRYFSGPEPWVQLERMPKVFADLAVATVYSEGPRVRWVVLEMNGPSGGWFETTEYFFDENGWIRKRERSLEHEGANIRVEEHEYFQAGKLIKTSYRHSALKKGAKEAKENWENFFDPNAPEYSGTGDLPAAFQLMEYKQLAWAGGAWAGGPPSADPARIQRFGV